MQGIELPGDKPIIMNTQYTLFGKKVFVYDPRIGKYFKEIEKYNSTKTDKDCLKKNF